MANPFQVQEEILKIDEDLWRYDWEALVSDIRDQKDKIDLEQEALQSRKDKPDKIECWLKEKVQDIDAMNEHREPLLKKYALLEESYQRQLDLLYALLKMVTIPFTFLEL